MKRIINILIILMLVLTVLTVNVSAGDENDPEIIDEERDLLTSRELYPFPKIFYPYFKYIDIISGWFSENQETPDILSVSLKVKIFEYKPFNTRLVFWWFYNGVDYVAAFITHSNGLFEVGVAGYIDENETEILNPVDYLIDKKNNSITFRIPKNYIGNPKSGDKLLDPWIWTGCGFQNKLLSSLWKRELAKDYTNPIEGRSYLIQY